MSRADLAPHAAATGQAPWVLVAGGFHPHGGMDKANRALAAYLIGQGVPVHLVAHSVDASFRASPLVTVHEARRPAGSFFLGEWVLEQRGRAVAGRVRAEHPDVRVLVNGGNCRWPDVNWVHSVHHAWPSSDVGAPAWFRAKNRLTKAAARRREARALGAARVVIANSEATRAHLLAHLGLAPERVRTVYLGADAALRPPTPAERAAARAWLGRADGRPVVVFVGTLGHDNNKGLDTLLAAWARLCARPEWDADLVVAGGGRGLERWRAAATAAGLAGRVEFLGFTRRVADLLAAADLLVSPVRYEAYGLNVQEALCRGVPAIVSRTAGVAEHYTPDVAELLLPDPDDAHALEARLLAWRARADEWGRRIVPLSGRLRAHGWTEMAREIVAAVEVSPAAAGRTGPAS